MIKCIYSCSPWCPTCCCSSFTWYYYSGIHWWYCIALMSFRLIKKKNSNCFGLVSFVCLLFLYCKFQTTHDVLRYAANYILFFWKETPNMGCFSNLFINHKTKRKANKIVRIICYINQALHSMYEQLCIFWIPGSGVIKHILGRKPGVNI